MRVLYNALIRTQADKTFSSQRKPPSAIAIDHGRVVQIGSDAEMLSLAGSHAETQDMEGKTIWPGLTDAHIHLQQYAMALQMINCETSTQAECLRRVAQKAAETPPGTWIYGHGWNQNDWPEGFGYAADLDAIAPNHPIYLTAKSLHASWANSLALRAVGITRHTQDPAGGRIGRDANGELNGLLFESAIELFEKAMPAATLPELTQAIDAAQAQLWQYGITGVHDYDSVLCFTALQLLQEQQKLHLRVVKGIPLPHLEQAIALGLRTGFGNAYLRIGSVKLFADGALGPRTAAMFQPYEGEPQNKGVLLLDNEQVFEIGQKASANGISVAIHAIGDQANHEVIQGYAQLRRFEQQHHLPMLRHRIEHVQILHPDDEARLAELNVIASVQPIHATSDMFTADRYWGKRSTGAYAFRTLLDQGTHMCFGSDAPVESPNPFLGIHAAVTRQRADGSPAQDGWYPAQRLHLEEALAGYTTGPAYAAHLEGQVGQLTPDAFADLIVLDQDPFTTSAQYLYQVQPDATMVGGEWVWQRK